jgi:23S rRNA pseudouridine1911/1915/1917 synthase
MGLPLFWILIAAPTTTFPGSIASSWQLLHHHHHHHHHAVVRRRRRRRRGFWHNDKSFSGNTWQFSTETSFLLQQQQQPQEKRSTTSPSEQRQLPRFKFRYLIEKSHTVQQNDDHYHDDGTPCSILALLMQHFDYTSSSQARTACRQGAILILRKDNVDDDDDDERGSKSPNGSSNCKKSLLQADSFDNDDSSSSLWENRHAIAVNALAIVHATDIVVRITRLSASSNDGYSCYPVEQTAFVQPPDNFYTLQWSDAAVLYQDNHIAVVNKPPGLATMGVARHDLESILPFMLQPPPPPPPPTPTIVHSATTTSSSTNTNNLLPRPVHRLDYHISGLVVVAKSQQALVRLSEAFADQRQQRVLQQTYTALVVARQRDLHSQQHEHDAASGDTGTIDYPINGKPAIADWGVLRRGQHCTMLEVKPIVVGTGNNDGTLQVRRHLSYCLKTPIVGDNAEYAGKNGKFKPFRQDCGLFLCRSAITFPHPMTGEELTFEIPTLPAKFQEFLDMEHDMVTSTRAISSSSSSSSRESSTKNNSTSLQDYIDMVKAELHDQFSVTKNEGVSCTGEPPIDPSRMINPNQGDSEWMDDW